MKLAIIVVYIYTEALLRILLLNEMIYNFSPIQYIPLHANCALFFYEFLRFSQFSSFDDLFIIYLKSILL